MHVRPLLHHGMQRPPACLHGCAPALRAQATREELTIPSVRLEDQVAEDVLLLKVDVEGWEWSVMQGAARLVGRHNVENIIMEYSPGGWGAAHACLRSQYTCTWGIHRPHVHVHGNEPAYRCCFCGPEVPWLRA